MSKWIDETEDGEIRITLAARDRCIHLYNEVCVNDASPFVADFPDECDCARCTFFVPEDTEEAKAWER